MSPSSSRHRTIITSPRSPGRAGLYRSQKRDATKKSLIRTASNGFARGEAFDPEKKVVSLKNGDSVSYEYLVVCTGIRLTGTRSPTLRTLGKNGVCSNYSPEHVTYTRIACRPSNRETGWYSPSRRCRSSVRAPQKIAYLAADELRARHPEGLQLAVPHPRAGIFGFRSSRASSSRSRRYGIEVHYQSNLVAVDGAPGPRRSKWWASRKGERVTVPFDVLH